MKTYSLLRSTSIFVYCLLVFLLLLCSVMLYKGYTHAGMPPVVALLVFAILGWVGYFYLKIPTSITLRDDRVLEFKSPLNTTPVPVADLISIKAVPLKWGFIKVTYTGGAIRLLCQITGLYELLSTIKAENPQVEITGC